MNTSPDASTESGQGDADGTSTTRQRFGRVTDRQPSGSGPGGRLGTYFVRDDETNAISSFSYADIVTEGFRTIRTGERIRFLTDPATPGHATYVIRLDLPDIEEYYK
ncbi:MAG TPA: hypothetical protein VKS82_13265 [Streptosporangiaceae bacterium]|nr:hypothetical protein [Streptosporangiaceae bacterium]